MYVSSIIGVINNISLTISLTSRDKIQFQRAYDRIAKRGGDDLQGSYATLGGSF